jgi:hypothetical protein
MEAKYTIIKGYAIRSTVGITSDLIREVVVQRQGEMCRKCCEIISTYMVSFPQYPVDHLLQACHEDC